MDYSEQKRKVESLLRVKFPGSWAPPPINPLRPGGFGGNYVREHSDTERHARMMEAIEAERRELMKKPDAELDAAYTQAMREVQEREKLKTALKEKGHFFNRPDASADFAYWAKADYWSLDESVALLLGRSPEKVNWKAVQPFVNISEFAKQYERLRNLAVRSSALKHGQSPVHPSAVLAWADEKDITVPGGLRAALKPKGKDADHTDMPAPLLVQVAGREAVPVRAIPFITGWSLAPDALAHDLARDTAAPFGHLTNTKAFVLNGGNPQPVLVKEWDGVVATLAGFEAGLKQTHGQGDAGYSLWLREAAAKLPAGVFLWRDDFESDYARGAARLVGDAREGERDLTYTPMLDEDLRAMVLQGFPGASNAKSDESRNELPERVAVANPESPEAPMAAAPRLKWPLKKPTRDDGLATPIFRLLKAAQQNNLAKPTASDLLEAFRRERPPEIVRVLADGCDFFDRRGREASADLESIRKRIAFMTAAQPPRKTRKR